MKRDREAVEIRNHAYQCRIANSLVNSMGRDCAIDTCYRNGWGETLVVILRDERYGR